MERVEFRLSLVPFTIAFGVTGILCARTIDRSGRAGVWLALACFVLIVIMWVVPDRRIARAVRRYEARTDRRQDDGRDDFGDISPSVTGRGGSRS